jgi:hypothetical protein
MEIMTAARGRVEREKGQLGSACIMLGAAGGGWLWQLAARWSRYGHAAQAAICPLLLAWVHGVDETWDARSLLFARVMPLSCAWWCLCLCWFGRVLGLELFHQN